MNPDHRPWEEHWDFNIGLKPIAEAHWLEGGEADPRARKDALLAQHRSVVWGECAGSLPGQIEVAQLIERTLGPDPIVAEHPPLYQAARRVADDLVLMEKIDGVWRVSALSLSSPTFFSAHEVIGKSLGELHGPVHGFADRFLNRVTRIFDGLRDALILERRNWTLVNSDETFTPLSAPVRARIGEITPETAGRQLYTRVERQTLRRLPRTGGALFTIRIWLTPLEQVTATRAGRDAFVQAWTRSPEDFRTYKGFAQYESLVAAYLRALGETDSVNGR